MWKTTRVMHGSSLGAIPSHTLPRGKTSFWKGEKHTEIPGKHEGFEGISSPLPSPASSAVGSAISPDLHGKTRGFNHPFPAHPSPFGDLKTGMENPLLWETWIGDEGAGKERARFAHAGKGMKNKTKTNQKNHRCFFQAQTNPREVLACGRAVKRSWWEATPRFCP